MRHVLELADGLMTVDVIGGEQIQFSQSFSCPDCGISIDEIEPRSFSFNNPFGACPECFGLGYKMEFDEDLMIPDKRLSLAEGAIQVMGWQSSSDPSSYTYAILKALAEEYDFDLNTPYEELPEADEGCDPSWNRWQKSGGTLSWSAWCRCLRRSI